MRAPCPAARATTNACLLLCLMAGAVQGSVSSTLSRGMRRAGVVPRSTAAALRPGIVARSQKFSQSEDDVANRAWFNHLDNALSAKPTAEHASKKPSLSKALAGAAAASLAIPGAALAKGGEFGALEGGFPALVHPVMMLGLYATTLYAGFLGWQIRRTRTIGDEINALKALAPKLKSGKTGTIAELQAELEKADGASKADLQSDIAALQAFSSTDAQIQALVAERKELTKGNFRDRHFQLSSLLLALGVGIGIEGPVNTWMRTGKLFPGPHLFAGAGVVVLWAAAAALVPAMQKGNKFAKDLHVALNAANVGLFSWQILTGIPIVQKVLEIKFGIKI